MAEYADARSQCSESSSEPFREVRIALVCYGGVSLAIYMHGVTRELHRLVAASSRFDADQNPFEPRCTEHVYWELLQHLAARDRVRTQVVVDVISGTSAGGINGVSSPRQSLMTCPSRACGTYGSPKPTSASC
jgi:hypothetical protein